MSASNNHWCDLIAVDALEEKDVTPAYFQGQLLAVYDTKEGITVSDARCTHAGANLCDGYFDGRHIECPLHQGLFDAVTGGARAAPVVRALRMYESRVSQGIVQIRATPLTRD
ncbi:MAG: Rieske 2Fe-2S domain-containing protein [Granulosicoccus sp.]